DRAKAAAELGSNLLVAVTLHLAHGDGAQRRAVQALEQPAILLGHLGGEGGRRLRAFELFQGRSRGGRVRGAGQGGLVEHGPASPLLPALVLRQVRRLAGGEEDEELPQVQAVVQLGKAAVLGPPAEAVEGAESDVLLVGGAAGRGAELLAGQTD